MKKFYLKFRVFLMSFAVGLASVSYMQSVTDITTKFEQRDAVLIIPVEEKQTQSKLVSDNTNFRSCPGVPDMENKPITKNKK